MKKNCYNCKYSKIGCVCWCRKKLKIISEAYIIECKDHEGVKKRTYNKV
jgi:hypothetical protein